MDTERMIRELRNIAEKHRDDLILTGHLNISLMCQDVATRLEELKPYEDTGLTPEKIMELKEAVHRLDKIFGDEITVDQVIDFFVDFYIAQCDDERVEAAELLTNEEVERYKQLKERDTALPLGNIKGVDNYRLRFGTCPSCKKRVSNVEGGNFCQNCGQRLKWED